MNTSAQVRHILIIEDFDLERTVNLDAATYSIGRHSSNDIILSCQKTSRQHATFLRRTDVKTNKYSYWILDGDLQGNRSRNGIYINDKKCLVHELKHGDHIRFSSNTKAKYQIIVDFSDIAEEPIDTYPSANINPVNNEILSSQKTVLHKETIVSDDNELVPLANNQQIKINSFAELSPNSIIEIDLYGKITYINSAAAINFKDIYQKQYSHPLLEDLVSQLHAYNGKKLVREIKVEDKIFQQTSFYLKETEIIRSYISEITQQKSLENKIQKIEALYENLVEQITEGILVINEATKQIVEVNRAACEYLGYSSAEILQMTIYELSLEEEKFARILQEIIAERSDFKGIALLKHQDGSIINANIKIDLVNSGKSEDLCIILYESQQQNNFRVDSLSVNLAKRDIFHEQLLTAIANAKRSHKLLAIMFFSLNFLPDIKNTFGYDKSSDLLSNLAERLKSTLRSGDTVTHWQEGTFVLLMPQISGIEEVAKIVKRLKTSLGESFKLGEKQFSVNTNIGIAIYPQDGIEIDILLHNANTALQRAQKTKSYFQFFSETMNSQASVMLELENLLHNALERNEFRLFYQPQINVNNGNVEGIEALLRWEHPELGLVAPNSFIKLAEKTGLIIPIGQWVIYNACQQNKQWQSQGLPPLRVSVNLSPIQFQQPNFLQNIQQILEETELEANLLELEISALTLMENIEYGRHTLNQLQDLGVFISIDDFATGFSSLDSLKQFPFNTLKIDRTFVRELSDNPQDLAIISALVELGKGFNARVVAEGVETKEQLDILNSLNCEQMQGFWFSRPLGVDEATKLLPFNCDEEKVDSVDSVEQND